MSNQVDDFRAGDKSLSAYVHRVTSAIGAQMSPTGRRAATSVAASKGRQWVNRTLEDRPTRGEIRAWFELVLDERRGLHNRVEALTKENEALTAQRDEALADADRGRHMARRGLSLSASHEDDRDRLRAELDAVRAQRDEALEALSLVRETVARQLGRYEELRVAYDQAEGERNELARRVGVGRASCSHTSRGGAE